MQHVHDTKVQEFEEVHYSLLFEGVKELSRWMG